MLILSKTFKMFRIINCNKDYMLAILLESSNKILPMLFYNIQVKQVQEQLIEYVLTIYFVTNLLMIHLVSTCCLL